MSYVCVLCLYIYYLHCEHILQPGVLDREERTIANLLSISQYNGHSLNEGIVFEQVWVRFQSGTL